MNKFRPTWSRREFLAAVTVAGAGTALIGGGNFCRVFDVATAGNH